MGKTKKEREYHHTMPGNKVNKTVKKVRDTIKKAKKAKKTASEFIKNPRTVYQRKEMHDDGDGKYTPVPGEPYINPVARPKPHNVTLRKNKARKQRKIDEIFN